MTGEENGGESIKKKIVLLSIIIILLLFASFRFSPLGNIEPIKEVKGLVGSHLFTAVYEKAYIWNDHDAWPAGAGEWKFWFWPGAEGPPLYISNTLSRDGAGWCDFPDMHHDWLVSGSTSFGMLAFEWDTVDVNLDYESEYQVNIPIPGVACNELIHESYKQGDVTHYYAYKLANYVPTISAISGPSIVSQADTPTFTVSGYDLEDSITYLWTLDGVTLRTRASTLSFSPGVLSVGTHTISAKVVDALWSSSVVRYKTITVVGNALTVVSPNGGEVWAKGTTHTISWTTGGIGGNVYVDVLKSGSLVWWRSAPNTGSFSWTIPTTLASGSDYKVRIMSTSNSGIYDLSNGYFTIGQSPPTSSITVTSPNGGEVWAPGSTHTITWNPGTGTGANVKIDLLKAGVVVGTAVASTPNDGSFSWTISSTRPPGTDYKIRVSSTSTTASDTSDSTFTIGTGPPPTATITVTSPNGGESWQHGTTHLVTWTYTGNPGANVKIELLKAGAWVGTATSSTPLGAGGTGSFSWPISATRALGADYKIRVSSTTTSASDTSNNNFAIT